MITEQLFNPRSITVVGASEDPSKPGGAILSNLKNNDFKGELMAVNPKAEGLVQGVPAYRSVEDLPHTDLAILAIPAKLCTQTVDVLCRQKGCKAVIIISAGFSEDSEQGAKMERQIVDICNESGATLIGPNCIGVLTSNFAGAFTKPIPQLVPGTIDFVSGSGATMVFILEVAMQLGLQFSSLISIGNCAQTSVEDMLEYYDNTYVHGKSAQIKMFYIENIGDPERLLKHASSLRSKGAVICAIKSGYSAAGSRAASSHTGAMASPDKAVDALFRKAGIIRCYGRTDLVTTAAVLMGHKPDNNRMAIISHAGGPAVMLTDVLSTHGIEIPHLEGEKAEELLKKLYLGSSVGNPIDFLATGTAEQLGEIIDACERDFDVGSMSVIFGNPGLTTIYDVYDMVLRKQKECRKCIFPIFTSPLNAAREINYFKEKGGICFQDEVLFGQAFSKVMAMQDPFTADDMPKVDTAAIRSIIDSSADGYLEPEKVQGLLDAAGIPRAKEIVAATIEEALEGARETGWPLVMKVVGPVHKSDVGGVVLGVKDEETLRREFERMMQIPQTVGILLQPMLSGTEIFAGAKREGRFGHIVLCGLGGIFIEVLKDVTEALAPIGGAEAHDMIARLKGYKILKGVRGQEGVDIDAFAEVIQRLGALCCAAPEIYEMDINPLLGNSRGVTAVDARIRIQR